MYHDHGQREFKVCKYFIPTYYSYMLLTYCDLLQGTILPDIYIKYVVARYSRWYYRVLVLVLVRGERSTYIIYIAINRLLISNWPKLSTSFLIVFFFLVIENCKDRPSTSIYIDSRSKIA